ncbi:MAG TPA: DUF2914 domain-containing protein [Gammaproteobacteria bacterium]|nr:DUF2914 domain-containing protein [Gammaproteobacteria bacterium]
MVKKFSGLLVAGLVLMSQTLPAAPPAPDPAWKVARAQFTTAIEEREPVDEIAVLVAPLDEIFFFTDLRHLQGRTVQHRWSYQGEVVSRVPFKVEGERWRVFSRMRLHPDQTGEWSVTVYDESGWPLHTELFRYEAAAPATAGPSAESREPVLSPVSE